MESGQRKEREDTAGRRSSLYEGTEWVLVNLPKKTFRREDCRH